MRKKNRFLISIILLCLMLLTTPIWIYNYNIINGNFDRVIIIEGEEITEIITDKEDINNIIKQINDTPRNFHTSTGFTYDYLKPGILIFENDNEKIELRFVVPKGNILTKHWEIETEFDFRNDFECNT